MIEFTQGGLVKLERLRSGIGHSCLIKYKPDLFSFPNSECGTTEQTADYIFYSALTTDISRNVWSDGFRMVKDHVS